MENIKTALGIELGSTRIKAVAIDSAHKPVSSGDYTWGLLLLKRCVDLFP